MVNSALAFAVEARAPSLLLKSRDQIVRDRDFDGHAHNHAPALLIVELILTMSARSVVINVWPERLCHLQPIQSTWEMATAIGVPMNLKAASDPQARAGSAACPVRFG